MPADRKMNKAYISQDKSQIFWNFIKSEKRHNLEKGECT